MKLKSILPLPLFLLLSGLLFGSVTFADDTKPGEQPLPLDELRLFTEVFGKIKSAYVDKADDETLLRDAIQGMLAGLDPHSFFLDAEAFREMRMSSEGKFNGLGLEIAIEDGLIRVIAPIDDTPAQRADIQPGDLIIMLDGVSAQGMGLPDALEGMRGPPGSEVVLTISRGDNEVFDVKLVRALIEVAEVKSEMLEAGFGYIRIASFQSDTGANLRDGIEQLEQQNGGALKGLVLDLRNNPGGVLHGAADVSDAFLNSGLIVSTRGRNADANHSFRATSDDLIDDAPVVVLVNGGSASASEIVAGALQDHKRAIIMGTRTFGKGSVQTVIPIDNGGALKLTTARYYTPSNRSIQARGIVPDIIIEAREPATTEPSEREIREADLAGHLPNDRAGDAAGDDKTDSSDLAKRETRAKRDYQVGEALNLLKGMSLVRLRGQEGIQPAPASGVSGEG